MVDASARSYCRWADEYQVIGIAAQYFVGFEPCDGSV